jgi:hypothetical protein
MTQMSINCTIERMAFKGTITLIAIKEYWYEKLQRHKGHCEKNAIALLQIRRLKISFTAIKKQVVNSKKTGPYC